MRMLLNLFFLIFSLSSFTSSLTLLQNVSNHPNNRSNHDDDDNITNSHTAISQPQHTPYNINDNGDGKDGGLRKLLMRELVRSPQAQSVNNPNNPNNPDDGAHNLASPRVCEELGYPNNFKLYGERNTGPVYI